MSPTDTVADDGLAPLRSVIAKYDLAAKKSLGQNFILDLNLTRRIARTVSPQDTGTIIEIGPGPGGLTRGLLAEGASRVIAIERDHRCRPALEDISRHYPDKLFLTEADALTVDWAELLSGAPRPIRIAANLPYGIATALLVGWLETEPWPPWYDRMALMFQKEVGERIVATPGTKAYGRLAVLAQWRTEAFIELTLKPAAFTPPPKVDSAVVVLKPRDQLQPSGCTTKSLSKVTAAAFGQRRKMLRQSLKTLVTMPELLLNEVGISPEARPETLTVAQFANLAAAYSRLDETPE
ncbi:MAG: 16S rRNA (adenine(1518)-N(6)/adenine(1519)-N(6))-dimethyltransferase RsmA [Hyphomicrobiaceae bacterium]